MKLEYLKIATQIASTIIIPIVIAWVGHQYSLTLKQIDIANHNIEIATNILSQKPEDHNIELRGWAVKIINKYSEIELPTSAAENLILKSYYNFLLDGNQGLDNNPIGPTDGGPR
ncbi:MAG: hypothetical protein RJQ09_04505 [Cyclobacteriaceae bacterium]